MPFKDNFIAHPQRHPGISYDDIKDLINPATLAYLLRVALFVMTKKQESNARRTRRSPVRWKKHKNMVFP